MKTGYIVTAIITFVLTIAMLSAGCSGIAEYIISCKTCEQFNIDNIELRTQTDIKNAMDVWCRYNDSTRTKTAVFYMDIKREELSNYISFSSFSKVGNSMPQFKTMQVWNDSLKNIPISNLYYKQGRHKKDSWIFVFDSVRNTLWSELIEDK